MKSYAVTVVKPTYSTTFKIPMRYPMDVNGELGFIVSEVEMAKATKDHKYAIVMKFMQTRPTVDNIQLHVVKNWGFLESQRLASWMIFMF